MKAPALLLLAFLLAAPVAMAQGEVTLTRTAPAEASADILATLEASGNFTTLVAALRSTGLADALTGSETYTLFAPTDEAFKARPDLAALNNDELTELLRTHLLVGAVSSGDAAARTSVSSVQGETLAISATGDAFTVNGVVVTEADIAASNGVIHVIDAPLAPEPVQEKPATDEPTMDHHPATDHDSPAKSDTADEIGADENVSAPAETDDAY